MNLAPIDTQILLAVIRGTALLSGALLLATLARRSSGAVKHMLWTVTVGALLALPLLAGAMPQVGLPALTQVPPGEREVAVLPSELALVLPAASVGVDAGSPIRFEARDNGTVAVSQLSAVPAGRSVSMLLVIWLAGFAFALASLLTGMVRASRLAHRAFPVADPLWRDRLRRAMTRAGVTRPVALRCSTDITVPMTGGLRRPVILLPVSAAEWSTECLDVVLMHELVHVRRADVLRQVLTRLAVALYWFHPLVWRAAGHAILAREQACDEAVLAAGTRPSRYARHLLALADDASTSFLVPSLVGLNHAHLEERVMSILKHSPRPRGGLAMLTTAASVVALTLSAAMLGPREVRAQEVEPSPPPVVTVAPVAPRVVAPLPPIAVRVAPPAVAGVMARVAPRAPMAVRVVPRVASHVAPRIVSGVMSRVIAPTATTRAVVAPRVAAARSRCGELLPRSNGPTRQIHETIDGMEVCAQVSGNLDELPDDALFPSGQLPIGMTVTLIVAGPDVSQKMVITRGADGNDHAWFVGGARRSFDAEAAAWRDALLAVLEGSLEAARVHGEVAEVRGEVASRRGEEASLRGEMAMVRAEVARVHAESAMREREARAAIESRPTAELAERHAVEVRDRERVIERAAARMEQEMSRLERRMAEEGSSERLTELHEAMEIARQQMAEVEQQHAEIAEVAEVALQHAQAMQEVEAKVAVEAREYARAVEAHAEARQVMDVETADRLAALEQQIRQRRERGEVAELEARLERMDADGRLARIHERTDPARQRLLRLVRSIGN